MGHGTDQPLRLASWGITFKVRREAESGHQAATLIPVGRTPYIYLLDIALLAVTREEISQRNPENFHEAIRKLRLQAADPSQYVVDVRLRIARKMRQATLANLSAPNLAVDSLQQRRVGGLKSKDGRISCRYRV